MKPPTSSDVPARPASTVVAVRPAGGDFEVLMVRRNRSSRFMGGAHVFPGGAVEECDRGALAAKAVRWEGDPEEFPWRAAALRELAEEAGVVLAEGSFDAEGLEGEAVYRAALDAGVVLDAGRLEYLSNWVTPAGLPLRFDARFYVATLPTGTEATSDRREVFDAEWVTPAGALEEAAAGRWMVELPTRTHLELLAGMASIDQVVDHARDAVPTRIEPRIAVGPDGNLVPLLPGDPGFEEAG